LEQADGGDPGGARREASGGVFERDAADGKYGNRYRAADFAQWSETLGHSEGGFRGRGEDRAEEEIAGAVIRGGLRGFQRVAGNTNQEIFAGGVGLDELLRLRNRQTRLSKMNASGPLRECDVETIVNQDARSGAAFRMSISPPHGLPRDRRQVFGGKILLSQLYPIYTC